MQWTIRRTLLAMAVALPAMAALSTAGAAAEPDRALVIGTGNRGAVYYPAGRALCRIIAQHTGGGITCDARESLGSVANIAALRAGRINLAIVQSDAQFNAYRGSGTFKAKGAFKAMRALFSLHAEPFTVLAKADAGVWKLDHLPGRRINVGKKGSGPRETFLELMAAMGWRTATFAAITRFGVAEQPRALCDGRTDVITFVVGHPAASVRDTVKRCGAVLVNIHGAGVKRLIERRPYYRAVRIPAGLYRGMNSDIRTFGVSATLVTSAGMKTEIARALTEAVFENLAKFRTMHPALKYLNRETMAAAALSAPLHAGAKAYFEQAGLR